MTQGKLRKEWKDGGWRPCDLDEHFPDARPERKLLGRKALQESVTAGVKLTDRYLYHPVIGAHRRIWRCYYMVTSLTDTTKC